VDNLSPPEPRLRAVDLFCGAGGLSEGFKQVGFEVSFAIDSDLDSCETYRANHKTTDVEHAPITALTPSEIEGRAGGDVDVVVGGPSCQGFSTAHKTRWNDPESERNRLWHHMLAVVGELRPKAFLMENVPGLVLWKNGNFGATILKEFRALGYNVSEPHILLAADFGVPQRRRRLFVVGLLGDEYFEWPEPTHLGGWRRDTLDLWERRRQELGLLRHLSCWEAISDLPLLEGTTGHPAGPYAGPPSTPFQRRMRRGATVLRDHEAQQLGEVHRQLVAHVPRGGTWRDIPPYLLPDRFRGMRRTDSSNLLGRLDPALPAYTITTQFTNVTVGCFTHPYEDRALSVREAARLQTFPDRYRFSGSLASRARQVGNAVPPVLAAVLADAIARQIGASAAVLLPPRLLKPSAQLPAPPATATSRRRMKAQKRSDTRPEALMRGALARLGIAGYETDVRPLPDLRRTADAVFFAKKVAVFVDGCFWHGCAQHSRDTKSNTKWWRAKIDANRARDADTDRQLDEAGWTVVRVWEHESPDDAALRVVAALDADDGSATASAS
jgi:DNA (cytosine-5)-methyltransferase 1